MQNGQRFFVYRRPQFLAKDGVAVCGKNKVVKKSGMYYVRHKMSKYNV